jgi:hypothetical protein
MFPPLLLCTPCATDGINQAFRSGVHTWQMLHPYTGLKRNSCRFGRASFSPVLRQKRPVSGSRTGGSALAPPHAHAAQAEVESKLSHVGLSLPVREHRQEGGTERSRSVRAPLHGSRDAALRRRQRSDCLRTRLRSANGRRTAWHRRGARALGGRRCRATADYRDEVQDRRESSEQRTAHTPTVPGSTNCELQGQRQGRMAVQTGP